MDATGTSSQAQQSSADALGSANQAAASATTARNAADAAHTSATHAIGSANWARAQAQAAQTYARQAASSYDEAYQHALAAHQSAQDAIAAGNDLSGILEKAAQAYLDVESGNCVAMNLECQGDDDPTPNVDDLIDSITGPLFDALCDKLSSPSGDEKDAEGCPEELGGAGGTGQVELTLSDLQIASSDLHLALAKYSLDPLGLEIPSLACDSCLATAVDLLTPYLAPGQVDMPDFLLESGGLQNGTASQVGVPSLSMSSIIETFLTETTIANQGMAGVAENLALTCTGDNAQEPCLKVALGQRNADLTAFASANGFQTFIGDQYDQEWNWELASALVDPNVQINVSLKGFGGDTYQDRFLIAVKGSFAAPSPSPKLAGTVDERQMRSLAESVLSGARSWDSINFYGDDGQLLPKWPEPDWTASNLVPAVPQNNTWGLMGDSGGQLPQFFLCSWFPDVVGAC